MRRFGLPTEQNCSYCHALQPEDRPSQAAVADAVRDALRVDQNHNGIPDVMEAMHPNVLMIPVQRVAPRFEPPPAPGLQVLRAAVIVGGILGLLVGVFALSISAASRRRSPPTAVTISPVSTPPHVVLVEPPVPTLDPPTPKAKPKAKPKPPPAPIVPAPSPSPRPAPPSARDIGF